MERRKGTGYVGGSNQTVKILEGRAKGCSENVPSPPPTNYVVKSQKTTEDRGQIKAGTVDLSGWVFNLI